MGVIHYANMQFQAKICKFYVRTAAKFLISQSAREARKNWEKGGSSVVD